ncbi:caspase family protein [Bradyrhizobium sediminis]|uniref:Caspase family protein n=1 Tax=Bradyrhizobium sediminis TaxID=2840469 RepID=A0A975NPZ2_9BRAD|nr:caspase family protein [Bradyrhizobium sediminis]QWG19208.1 caspase family protein [Bradyrhizobium sediminis]
MTQLNYFFAGALLVSTLVGTAAASAADRVALVIGNGTYHKVPTLPNPTRDAADISKALERLNFKVTQISNGTAAEMRRAIVEFGRNTEGSDMAVVFYAGHGMEVGGENWLIPTDAELRSDTDVESEAVSLRSINLQVSKARQLGLVILDACRNNPFAAKMQRSLRTRAVTRGLAPTEPTDNVLVAYAARDGTTANDGDGRNSPFTAALLRNIETPGLEISFLFRNVRDEVMSATKREQQPFVYGSLSKEAIYLKPLATAPAQSTPAPSEAPVTTEDERAWKAIKTSSDASLYEDFLKRFAYSPHAAEVRQRLANLKTKQVVSIAPPVAIAPSAAAPTETIAKLSVERDSNKPISNSAEGNVRNLFAPEDAQRVAAMGTYLKLKMPAFAIGETKVDVPASFRRYVGIWVLKDDSGKDRQRMLILTEVSGDLALGYHVYGPPGTRTPSGEPAGYVFIAGKISDNVLRFNSGKYPVEVKLSEANAMTMQFTDPDRKSKGAIFRLTPLWQLIPVVCKAGFKVGDDNTCEPNKVRGSTVRRPEASGKATPAAPTPPRTAGGSTMEERYRACRKLVKGFAQREACARNGSI